MLVPLWFLGHDRNTPGSGDVLARTPGSDEELGALIAWIQAQKGSKRTLGKVVINLIDTSTGEVVWADEIRGTGRDAAKNAADRLAAAAARRAEE